MKQGVSLNNCCLASCHYCIPHGPLIILVQADDTPLHYAALGGFLAAAAALLAKPGDGANVKNLVISDKRVLFWHTLICSWTSSVLSFLRINNLRKSWQQRLFGFKLQNLQQRLQMNLILATEF
jgi:ankyrin repeat protein